MAAVDTCCKGLVHTDAGDDQQQGDNEPQGKVDQAVGFSRLAQSTLDVLAEKCVMDVSVGIAPHRSIPTSLLNSHSIPKRQARTEKAPCTDRPASLITFGATHNAEMAIPLGL